MTSSYKSRISWTGTIYAAFVICLSYYFTAEKIAAPPLQLGKSPAKTSGGITDIEPPVASVKNVSSILQKRIADVQDDFETVLRTPASEWVSLKTVKSLNLSIQLQEAKPPYVLSSIFIKADPKVVFSYFSWAQFNDTLLSIDPVFESSVLLHKISRQQIVIRKVTPQYFYIHNFSLL